MKNQKTCTCDAYRFPHRENGGKCGGSEGDGDAYDMAYENELERRAWERERRDAVRGAF